MRKHELPTTEFSSTNPFGVIPKGTAIDWWSVNDLRINHVDECYPCEVITTAEWSEDEAIKFGLKSNDFMYIWAQLRDMGLEVPIDGVPVEMTAPEWNAWSHFFNTWLAKRRGQS